MTPIDSPWEKWNFNFLKNPPLINQNQIFIHFIEKNKYKEEMKYGYVKCFIAILSQRIKV
jgi:hypothetical protein